MRRIRVYRNDEDGAYRFLFGSGECFVVVKFQPLETGGVAHSVKSWSGIHWVKVASHWNMHELHSISDSEWSAAERVVDQHYAMLICLLFPDGKLDGDGGNVNLDLMQEDPAGHFEGAAPGLFSMYREV